MREAMPQKIGWSSAAVAATSSYGIAPVGAVGPIN
jgi:hypothetical protein